jgi:hypothetical protein
MVGLDMEHLTRLNQSDRPGTWPYDLLFRGTVCTIPAEPLASLTMQVRRLFSTHLLQHALACRVVSVIGLRGAFGRQPKS